jgi:phosphatidylinositol alpha-1,6-mannosyltransferase
MDLGYAIKNKRKKFIADIILRNAKHIICANNYTANLIKINFAKFDNTKITVVNPGVDLPPTIVQKQLDNFKKKHQLHNKIVLFSLGRLVRRKGFDMVLGAMPEVLKIVPDLWYYIAGTGPDENYLRNMAQSLKNVTFLGEIEENDKWLWFYFCDIFIMPAREIDGDYEGFGIVFLEANIMGKPVIAGDSGGQKDAVQNALNGLIINPYSQEKIASAIIMLATERNTAQTMGENGRRIVLEKFNWSKQVNLFYQTIIN